MLQMFICLVAVLERFDAHRALGSIDFVVRRYETRYKLESYMSHRQITDTISKKIRQKGKTLEKKDEIGEQTDKEIQEKRLRTKKQMDQIFQSRKEWYQSQKTEELNKTASPQDTIHNQFVQQTKKTHVIQAPRNWSVYVSKMTRVSLFLRLCDKDSIEIRFL